MDAWCVSVLAWFGFVGLVVCWLVCCWCLFWVKRKKRMQHLCMQSLNDWGCVDLIKFLTWIQSRVDKCFLSVMGGEITRRKSCESIQKQKQMYISPCFLFKSSSSNYVDCHSECQQGYWECFEWTLYTQNSVQDLSWNSIQNVTKQTRI